MRRLCSKLARFKKRSTGWLLVALVYVLPFLAIPATGTLYLKVGDIKGDVVTKGYENWIEAHSVQFGINRTVNPKGGSRAQVSEVTITKLTDASTVPLFLEAVGGSEKDVDLELVRTGTRGAERYYKLKLYDVLVSAFSQSSGGDVPAESISLNFLKMELTYTEFVNGLPARETTAWYDLPTGTSGTNSISGNTAPMISTIANTNTMEDTAVTIPFTIGDAQTAAGSLSLSRTSGNSALLSIANITFGGSGSNRTVTLLPASNQTGNVNVTITVSDGSLSANTIFTLNIRPVNDAPQISAIAAQSTAQDTPITIGFDLSDPDNLLASLQLFATSSNAMLVPNENLVFGGSGAPRTLAITPAPGQTGQTTISIRASDGLLATTNSFLLAVSAPHLNEAPSFIVANPTVIPIIAGRSTSITRLQLSDLDAGMNAVALALQVVNGTITVSNWTGTIVSNGTANVFLSGSIPALNLLLFATNGINYRAAPGIAGTDLLTATVNDNGHSGSGGPQVVYTTLGLRIYASQYDEWLHQVFTQSELTNSTLENILWGFHADSDRDHLENLAEYGLGTAPRGTNHPRPAAELTQQAGGRRLALLFNRRKDPDLMLAVEIASDLAGPWASDDTQLETVPPVDLGDGFEQVRFVDRVSTSAGQKRFMRMRWTLSQPFASPPLQKSPRTR